MSLFCFVPDTVAMALSDKEFSFYFLETWKIISCSVLFVFISIDQKPELRWFLGGLSLHLNHLIAERVSAPYRQFGTLPIGIFLSNLDSGQLETSLMTSYCHF